MQTATRGKITIELDLPVLSAIVIVNPATIFKHILDFIDVGLKNISSLPGL
jgi:hypothetical protein